MPTFILLVKGKVQQRITGPISEDHMKRLMARIPRKAVRPLPVTETDSDFQETSPFRSPKPDETIRAQNETKQGPLNAPQKKAMTATVRIHVNSGNGKGQNYGSGIVIHSEPGKSIILTCGHLFRNHTKKTDIKVDLFFGKEKTTHQGTILRYDLVSDLGVIAIPTEQPVPTVSLAKFSTRLTTGTSLFTIGCGGGRRPEKIETRLTKLNPYLGPDNIECSGIPEQGRSGGGLFDAQGNVVGICFAADPPKKRGLYSALRPIYKLLAEAKLSNITKITPTNFQKRTEPRPFPKHQREESPISKPRSSAGSRFAALPKETDDAEIICIIRSRNNPKAGSRVIVINRATKTLMNFLNNEQRSQPQETMKVTPAPLKRTAATPPRNPAPSGWQRTVPAAPPQNQRWQRKTRRTAPPKSTGSSPSTKAGRYRRSKTAR